MSIERVIHTAKLGDIGIVLTDMHHVFIHGNQDVTTYRGKPVYFTLHLFDNVEGSEGVWRRRVGEYLYSSDLTFKGKEFVEAEVKKEFTAYIEANRLLLLDAEIESIGDKIRKIGSVIEDKEAELAEHRQELDTAKKGLENLKLFRKGAGLAVQA